MVWLSARVFARRWTLHKSLMTGEVNQAWIPAQPASRRNRIDEVLIGSWKALDGSSTPCVPRAEASKAAYQGLESAHKTDPGRSLAVSFAELIAPPYGMSAASATLMLALLVGLPSPPRGLLLDGTPINAADWVSAAFPRAKAKHYLDALSASRAVAGVGLIAGWALVNHFALGWFSSSSSASVLTVSIRSIQASS